MAVLPSQDQDTNQQQHVNKMLETKSVHLVARLDGVAPIRKADKRESLGHARIPVLGQEYSGDASKALEHVAKLPFLGHFRNLPSRTVSITSTPVRSSSALLTLVTRSVARSSLSPYFDPAMALADAAPPRRAGGT
ncbi:hypothetical protein HC256_003324 [Beauveria bassiana]|nr:hypothetical protein HC256_003324 [Beauveria bassiana]